MSNARISPLFLNALVQFTNHGILPFVGRKEEVKNILTFCETIDSFDSLGAMLVLGEAGVGKSRLFDEVIPYIISGGTAVVRAKLHSDTSESLITLIANALWRTQSLRSLVKIAPLPALHSVIDTLRRLSRLRRIVLIIEDIHLISTNSLGEFSALISALDDESIGLIGTARTIELSVRGIIEQYIKSEIQLSGLNNNAITDIWEKLFDENNADQKLVHRIGEKTKGNPLALRMVLRTAIRRDISPAAGGMPELATLRLDRLKLDHSLNVNVKLLSEGMATHLTEQERRWAAELAALGEVFSYEAAELYVKNSTEAINMLRSKGIIMESLVYPTPINGIQSEKQLLVFTHTLLHHHFVEQHTFDVKRFWDVLVGGAPLYSTLPFEVLNANFKTDSIDQEYFFKGISVLSVMIANLDLAGNITSASSIFTTHSRAYHYAKNSYELTEEYDADRYLVATSHFKYNGLYDTESRRQEYQSMLDEYVRITSEPLSPALQYHKIFAAGRLFTFYAFTFERVEWQYLDELSHVLKEYPNLVHSNALMIVLSWILKYINWAFSRNKLGYLSELKNYAFRYIDLIEQNAIEQNDSTDIQENLLLTVYPNIIGLQSTPEEMQRCAKIFRQMESSIYYNNHKFLIVKAINYLVPSGNAEKAHIMVAKLIARNKTIHHLDDGTYSDLFFILCGLYYSCEPIIASLRQMSEPEMCADFIAMLHLLRRDIAHEAVFNLDIHAAIEDVQIHSLLWHAHANTILLDKKADIAGIICRKINEGLRFETSIFSKGYVDSFGKNLFENPEQINIHTAQFEIAQFLANEHVEFSMFGDLLTLLILIEYSAQCSILDLRDTLRHEIRSAIFRTMRWLIDSKRIIFAQIFTEHFARYCTPNERKEWGEIINGELEEQHKRLRYEMSEQVGKVSLSMIGKIGYRTIEHSEIQKIKGNRLKLVLGAMILNEILPKPLTRTEFFTIAAGEEADEETRRNTVKVAVYQLRKLFGQDTIVQSDGVPTLNQSVLSIDLIHVWESFEQAERHLAKGSLKNATNITLGILRLLQGDVAFPTLYDEIFESAREDLEIKFRTIIMNLVEQLSEAGDLENCEYILRAAQQQLIGDEEITERLQQILKSSGKHIEAERVGKKLNVDSL